MRYWSTPPHTDIEESRVWLSRMITQSAATGCDFLVEYKGRIIGKAGCYEPANVGYIFHPDIWGRGFATEALAAVIQRVFEVGAFAALVADVDPRNVGSLRLLGRLGFREVGRAKQTWLVRNDWCDSVYLELERAEAPSHSPQLSGPDLTRQRRRHALVVAERHAPLSTSVDVALVFRDSVTPATVTLMAPERHAQAPRRRGAVLSFSHSPLLRWPSPSMRRSGGASAPRDWRPPRLPACPSRQ